MRLAEAEAVLMNGHAAAGSSPLADAVATFRRWLYMPDAGTLYVTLAAVAANRADGDPVWLLVVGPPGSGKTEIVNSIAPQRDVYPAATLTEGALLSGTAKRERATGAKGGLLREIGDFGILLHKDFGSVLSMNRDTRAAVLAALREVYDGAWTRYVGTDGGRTLSWAGKVGLIAGCTPAIDSHHAVVGSMGERFVLYRLPPTDADVQIRRALGHVGRESAMRAELAAGVDAVLGDVEPSALTAQPDEATTERLVRLSTLAVRCRSAVERDSYTRDVVLIPEAEAPARLGLVLLRLLNGLRAIGVDERTAWQLIGKCALDSMPAVRRTVLEYLIARPDEASTSAVAEATTYPTTTTGRALEDLTAHGIVEKRGQGQGRASLWWVSDWARGRWPGPTSPEMSVGMRTDVQVADPRTPVNPPLRAVSDKSGEVPDDGYGPGAVDVDPEPAT